MALTVRLRVRDFALVDIAVDELDDRCALNDTLDVRRFDQSAVRAFDCASAVKLVIEKGASEDGAVWESKLPSTLGCPNNVSPVYVEFALPISQSAKYCAWNDCAKLGRTTQTLPRNSVLLSSQTSDFECNKRYPLLDKNHDGP